MRMHLELHDIIKSTIQKNQEIGLKTQVENDNSNNKKRRWVKKKKKISTVPV